MSDGISIVIPAFNEQRGIGVTVGRLRSSSLPPSLEILVVDDGSTDNTETVAREAGARTIRHPHNLGYGASLKTGIRMARHDTIVIMDADGTYPAEAISELLEVYKRGFDMVVGARTGVIYRGSALKWPMRLVLRFLVEWTTGRHIPDINSGLRIFSRSCIGAYLPALSNSFSFTTSATLVYMLAGRFVAYQPIPYHARIGTSHVRMWRDSLRTMQYIVRTIALFNPMKLFVLLALISVLAGVVAGLIFGFSHRWDLGLLAFVLSALAAIVVFSLGLVVEALRRNEFTGEQVEPSITSKVEKT
jgi:glycosyltransferase involved in cell wall biosynthesis